MNTTQDAIEFASRDEITALQTERLKAAITHTYENVEPYKAKCDAQGVHPDDFGALADLAKFPFTTKADLREAYPYGLFAVPMENVARLHASSGTTGQPTVVGYTRADLDVWARLVARSIRAAGGRAGDKAHIAYGYGLFTGGLGAHYGAERLGCTVIPISGGQTARQVQLIHDLKPDIIMVTPSYMLNIADEMVRQDLSPDECSLRIGLFGAEPWTEAMRSEIESRVGLDATDIYGLSEVLGPGVAQECVETKDGPVIWEDFFYPEIIDTETEQPVEDGGAGELVLTTLAKEAMPLIRYRTRDLSRLLPPTARSMRRLQRIQGRSDDMLIIRGVNVYPSQFEALILGEPRLSPHYVLEMRREKRLDSLTVRVESRAEESDAARAELAGALEERIKDHLSISAHVEMSGPESIERSAGKARRVIDLRENTGS